MRARGSAHTEPGARVRCTIGSAVVRSGVCMRGAARSNCHTLALSLRTPGNAPTAFMPVSSTLESGVLRVREHPEGPESCRPWPTSETDRLPLHSQQSTLS